MALSLKKYLSISNIRGIIILLYTILPSYLYSLQFIWEREVGFFDVLYLLIIIPFEEVLIILAISMALYFVSKGICLILFPLNNEYNRGPYEEWQLFYVLVCLFDFILLSSTGDIFYTILDNPKIYL